MISGYLWAAFLLATFGWNALHARNEMERAGTLICIFGAIFLAYQWRRFAAKDMPHDLPLVQFLKTYRDELLRQQRLLQSAVFVSVLPLVLGLDIAAIGHRAARHAFHPASLALPAAFTALFLAFGWILARL